MIDEKKLLDTLQQWHDDADFHEALEWVESLESYNPERLN